LIFALTALKTAWKLKSRRLKPLSLSPENEDKSGDFLKMITTKATLRATILATSALCSVWATTAIAADAAKADTVDELVVVGSRIEGDAGHSGPARFGGWPGPA